MTSLSFQDIRRTRVGQSPNNLCISQHYYLSLRGGSREVRRRGLGGEGGGVGKFGGGE